jgi:hypothetical protein
LLFWGLRLLKPVDLSLIFFESGITTRGKEMARGNNTVNLSLRKAQQSFVESKQSEP